MNSQIILISSAADLEQAAASGLPLVRFGLGLDANGTPRRTIAQSHDPCDILCLSDFGLSAAVSPEIIRQLHDEIGGYAGVLADIDRESPHLDAFLTELDQICTQRNIPLFLPHARIGCAANAWAIVPGAASGGNLRNELEQNMFLQNGKLAVTFRRIRRRFRLPASDPHGEAISTEELEQAKHKIGAHIFFSEDLCLNYFTYMDGNTGTFILFDTEETLRARLKLIRELGVPFIFVEWEGCEGLFTRS